MITVDRLKCFMKGVRLQLRNEYVKRKTIFEVYDSFLELNKLNDLPPVDVVADSLDNDEIVCCLYSEMRYRRIMSRSPTCKDRIDSWNNYRRLFQSLCHNSDGTNNMWLPNDWLWDMVDHFVNQFESFGEFRANEQNMELLQPDEEKAWSVFATLSFLRTLVRDSLISQTFQDKSVDRSLTDSSVPHSLGYFAKVALLRVHCLLGQFQTGLNRLRPIQLFKPLFSIHLYVSQCSIAYHSALANLMLGSHVKALDSLNEFLYDFHCSEYVYEHSRHLEHIESKIKQMYALLAICHLVSSRDQFLHQPVKTQLLDFYGPNIREKQKQIFTDAWSEFTAPFEPDSYFKCAQSAPRRSNLVTNLLGSMYPQQCSPFDPDDEEPYKSLNQELEALTANIRMSKLKL